MIPFWHGWDVAALADWEKAHARRALINLSLCFPERSEAEREAIVDEDVCHRAASDGNDRLEVWRYARPGKFSGCALTGKGWRSSKKMRRNNVKVIFLVLARLGVVFLPC